MAVATWLQKSTASHGGKPYPVICDAGEHAFVVVLTLPGPPHPGLRFSVHGQLWEVVRAGDHVRGPVAQPVPGRTTRR